MIDLNCKFVLHLLIPVAILGLATVASAEVWNLSSDFSADTNPNEAWAFGSKTTLGAGLDVYDDLTTVESIYGTSQLAGWSDSTLGVFPYLAKNVSATDWVYDGTAGGGGIAVLPPEQVVLHPFSPSGQFSMIEWTAPHGGSFAIDVEFQRLEDVEGFDSDYFVLLNGLVLPGGSGQLVGFATPTSFGSYSNPSLLLNQGDKIEFVVGIGSDGTSNTDVTIVRAELRAVPEPGDFNRDNAVDAADYPVWRRLFAELVPACSGPDANCNGAVDKNDYQIWRNNFGTSFNAGSANVTSAAVPEPTSAFGCFLLGIIMLTKLRSRKG